MLSWKAVSSPLNVHLESYEGPLDLLLDLIVRLRQPLAEGADADATTQLGPGGQAANVAAWAAALGAQARYVGKRGADAAGELASRELAAYGVELAGPVAGRGGVVVSIVAEGERSMASDRGSATELEADELEPAWFAADALHVSGYALLREPAASAAGRAVELARAAGAAVSLDLSSWSLVDEPFRGRARRLAPDVVFATEREQEVFGELDASWVVKRGALGVRVHGVDHPALPADVVDPTGAGDALAAGFLLGGVEVGLEAAARCCAKLGAMP
jgi:sugar/nucleoside kinase (ribokinase family)